MPSFLIRNAKIVDSGKSIYSDLLVKDSLIEKIDPSISGILYKVTEINAEGKMLLPGIIDVHVHFREPGLTHKADIFSESKAAVTGGVTSFIEMPNTEPKTTTAELLKQKFELASQKSFANYSFYMGATNSNFHELEKGLKQGSPGVKIFMGSSTGNMLVDNEDTLNRIFNQFQGIVVVHAESENVINDNLFRVKKFYGENIPFKVHSEIRSSKACFESSRFAVELANKHNTRLHLAHLSSKEEIALLNNKPIKSKKITSEVCVHHLYFDDKDYDQYKGFIKCNPSIKSKEDKDALLQALNNGYIDLISTDHAPHTFEEKNNPYLSCPSGIPLIQHALLAMLEFVKSGKMTLEQVVQKMCHHPALAFNIKNRGFIKEGYKADCILIDLNSPTEVTNDSILYKCAWSPFEGKTFSSSITHSFVNGNLVWENGRITNLIAGEKLLFQ